MHFAIACRLRWWNRLALLLWLPAEFVPLLRIWRDARCAILYACANGLCGRNLQVFFFFCCVKFIKEKNGHLVRFYGTDEKILLAHLCRILGKRASSRRSELRCVMWVVPFVWTISSKSEREQWIFWLVSGCGLQLQIICKLTLQTCGRSGMWLSLCLVKWSLRFKAALHMSHTKPVKYKSRSKL